jgi:hybrid cluster-associated redox disulfide protein
MPVSPDDLVDDIMTNSPRTIRAFLDFGMHCVGCPIACFHTVRDACREHGVDCDAFLRALVFCSDAFSSREPVPTSLENALSAGG